MIQILHGDCREILPTVQGDCDLAYLDPPWPGASLTLAGQHDGAKLVRACCDLLPASIQRVILHLGCDTDPRLIVGGVPDRWPFLRVCWLRYARPSYKGRVLNGADVAYVFGAAPRSREGARVLPGETAVEGEYVDTSNRDRSPFGHPCPRRVFHVSWLLRWFCERGVIDPFAGSGTAAVAAQRLELNYLGMEVEVVYVEIARARLAADAPLLTTLGPAAQGEMKL